MSQSSKILIAGGGYADIPLIKAAKNLGFYVVTTGNRPQDIGHQYSDEYRNADFSNPEKMLELSKALDISAICSCCNDFSAMSCAYVAEQMGLPGHDSCETAKIIHHKDRYREFAWENGIPSPGAIGAENEEEALVALDSLSLPLIIKPVDLTGGKGISTVYEKAEARKAVRKAFAISREKRIVIEDYIQGSRHGFSAFLRNGHVVFYFVDNEYYFLNPYLVAGAFVPGFVPDSAVQELCETSEKIASLLSLKTGIFHVQFILKKGRPIIIEICRRAPGDLYLKLVEHATGVNYAKWIVRAAAGLSCEGLEQREPKMCLTRHCIMASRSGVFKKVVIDKTVDKWIIDKFMWGEPGGEVTDTDVLNTKFGIIFVRSESRAEMKTLSENLHNLVVAQIDEIEI